MSEKATLPPQLEVTSINVGELQNPAGDKIKVMAIEMTIVLPFDADAARSFANALMPSGIVVPTPGQVKL